MVREKVEPPRFIIPIMALVAGIGIVASAVYSPSVPAMVQGLSTGKDEIQATFTIYLITFAAGQLFAGPLVDQFGRRRLMLTGLLVMLLGSMTCAAAQSVEVLWAARFLQAAGACTTSVCARATIRDLFDGPALSRAISALTATIALSPTLAPVIGGALQSAFDWRSTFLFVAAMAVIGIWLVLRRVPETSYHVPVGGNVVATLLQSYLTLLRDGQFMCYALMIGGGSSVFYAFAVGAPVMLIGPGHLTPAEFGLAAGLPPVGFMAGSFLTNRLAGKVTGNTLLLIGGCWMVAVVGLGIVHDALTAATAWVAFPMMIASAFGNGLVFPSASVGAVAGHPRIAGAASALVGFTQMTGAAAGTLGVMLLTHDSALGLDLVMGVGALTVLVARLFVTRLTGRGGDGSPSGGR